MDELKTKHQDLLNQYSLVCRDLGDRQMMVEQITSEINSFKVKLHNLIVDIKKSEKELKKVMDETQNPVTPLSDQVVS